MFVGRSRHHIVGELVDAFDQVAAGSGSSVAVLVAPPGWGKTRIAQELYRRLAAERQTEPPYWPAAIVESGDESDGASVEAINRARKAVYPRSADVPAGARMDWIWWGLLCQERRDGQLSQALFDGGGVQLFAHAEALLQPGIDNPAGRAFDAATAAIGVLGLLGMAVVGPLGAPIALVGAAKVGWDNADIVRRLNEWLKRSTAADEGRTILASESASQRQEIAELINGLGRLSRARPLVVVVDDAHFADRTLVEVLEGVIADPANRVLVVATAWPSHLDRAESPLPFARWAGAMEGEERFSRIDLDELSDADVTAIVGEELPAAVALVPEIRGRYGANLLAIRAVLRLPRVRALAERGELDDRVRLPAKIADVYGEYWEGLPDGVRHVLALAAQLEGTRYLPDVVAAACEAEATVDAARERLEEGVSPYAWARVIDDSLHTFVEPVLHGIARARGDELLFDSEIEALRRAVVEMAIAEGSHDGLSPNARTELLEQHVALVEEASAPTGAEAAASALALAEEQGSRYAYARAIETARKSLIWSGRPADDPASLKARAEIALWQAHAGRATEATQSFRELLADQLRVLGPDDPNVLIARNNLAHQLGKSGHREEAITAFRELLEDSERILGPDHFDTLNARNNLASCIGDAERHEEAIAAFRELLDDCLRVLGSDDPLTLNVRNNLAGWLGQSGHPEAAIPACEELLADQKRILGPDHRSTMVTRSHLARWIGESGRPAEAVGACEELLTDQLRLFGPDHPDTLTTRCNRAFFLWGSGRKEEALAAQEAVIEDMLRIHGADHPDAVTVRNSLAGFLRELGRRDQAIAVYEGLLDDLGRSPGADPLVALAARGAIVDSLWEADRPEEALAACEELQEDLETALGADHPEALRARNKRAYLLLGAGRAAESVRICEELLVDERRILGPDHPELLVLRGNLAYSRFQAGQPRTAIAELETLLVDQRRVLGAEHPSVSATSEFLQELAGHQQGESDPD